MSDPADPAPSTPSNAATSSDSVPTRHCSECGWGTPSHKPPVVLWPRIALWLIPLVIFAFVIAMSFLAPSLGPTGLWHATQLIQPTVTRGDLRDMAAGQAATRNGKSVALTSMLLEEHVHDRYRFGDVRFQVKLVPPPHGAEVSYFSLGWPLPIAQKVITQRYRNILARDEPLAAASFTATATSSADDFAGENPAVFPSFDVSALGIFWTVAPERTRGKIIEYHVDWPSLIASLVIAVIGVWLSRRLVGMVLRKAPQRRVHRWRTIMAALTFLAILFVPLHKTTTHSTIGFESPSTLPGASTLQPGAALTEITVEPLRAYQTTAGADKALATDILGRLGDRPEDSANDVLLAGECREYMPTSTMYASPMALFAIGITRVIFERCPDFGVHEVVTMPKTRTLRFEYGGLFFLDASGNSGDPVQVVNIYLPGLLAAVGVSLLPGLILLAFHRRHVRRRGKKRLRERLCPSCAYPFPALAPVPSTTVPATPPTAPPVN